MTASLVHQSPSPKSLYYVTRVGGNLIDSVRALAPKKSLCSIMTVSVKVMLAAASTTKPWIPPEKDILAETFFSSRWKGSVFAEDATNAAGTIEFKKTEDFSRNLAALQLFLKYESEEVAIKHILLFAHFFYSYKREPCLLH